MTIPHPIPYQGSKRRIAHEIIAYFPRDAERLIEPFAGSAAVSIAAAYYSKSKYFILNDINEALMNLWHNIVNRSETTTNEYEKLWFAQKGCEREYYNYIRDEFNKTQNPNYFLYLLARCVKGSIRYNSKGEFNQSPDNRRLGMHPTTMRKQIFGASRLLKGKACIKCADYKDMLTLATPQDIVYMDPPYQGVCGNRDPRYFSDVAFHDFIKILQQLNSENISYILSYDGRTDLKSYGKPLPNSLELTLIEIEAGRSTQATLLGRCAYTIESLYLSKALVSRLGKVTVPQKKFQSFLVEESR